MDWCHDIVQIGDYYYILAATYSVYGDVTYNHGGTDIWLVKTDLSGDIVFEKCFGGSFGDGAYKILKVSDSSLYIVGGTKSVDGDISDNPYPGSSNFWILKLNTDGEIIWDKIVGGDGLERERNAVLTSDGGAFKWD